MIKSVDYDGEYIVGGKPNARIAPNFKLKELTIGGKVRVARELVGALRELRDAYGRAVKITGLKPRGTLGAGKPGCFAFVTATDRPRLDAAAKSLKKCGFVEQTNTRGRDLYLECPDPAKLPVLPAVSRGVSKK